MRKLLLVVFVSLGAAGCSSDTKLSNTMARQAAAVPQPSIDVALGHARDEGRDGLDAGVSGVDPHSLDDVASISGANVPYQCEEFEVHVREDGTVRYKRKRRPWTKVDRQRFKKLVGMVAEEMGAEPRLFTSWALRESTFRPTAIHVLNNDVEASASSWKRHRYDPILEQELTDLMKEAGAQDKRYWKAKAKLSRITRFKGNKYADAEVGVETIYPNGERETHTHSRWSYGYGPFGFNPSYFLQIWDEKAPPWVFCSEDGVIAIVTAVWAARNNAAECRAQGYGDSYETVNRRFSSGHCEPRPSRAHFFRKRARSAGLDPTRRAKLGTKWPQDTTDRGEILDHMRSRAREQGLLSSSPPLQ